jgi:xylulokinase
MSKEGYLGLDLGGTGVKAAVFDRQGKPLALAHRPYRTEISPEGHAELDIRIIDKAAREAVREATGRAQVRVLALSISSQGQTFVTLDATDRPLHRVIAWFDSRAVKEARQIHEDLEESDRQGLDLSPIASAAKILWLRKNRPEISSRAARILLLPDYVTYRLTGQAVCDPVMAWTTGLFSESEGEYRLGALRLVGVAREQLSGVAPAGTRVGEVLPRVADEWGLEAGTQVAVGTNDQLAGALGAGNVSPGIVSETTGTCLALITLAQPPLPQLPRGLFQGPSPVFGFRYLLAYSKTAGLLLEWFRSQLGAGRSLEDLDAEALLIAPGSQGLSVLPHFDGMVSPNPNPSARGAFINLSLRHTPAHLYRAILESVAFSLRENLELITTAGFRIGRLRSIGGGARSDVWLQIKADVTGQEIERPLVPEAAVLGAAMMAATCVGHFKSVKEASEALYKGLKVFYPRSAAHQEYEEYYGRYVKYQKALYPLPAEGPEATYEEGGADRGSVHSQP